MNHSRSGTPPTQAATAAAGPGATEGLAGLGSHAAMAATVGMIHKRGSTFAFMVASITLLRRLS